MASDPVARYATPLDLARDLERWLTGEPVEAYSEPWGTRAARWAARHRIVTGAAAALGTVGLMAGLAAWHQAGLEQAMVDSTANRLEHARLEQVPYLTDDVTPISERAARTLAARLQTVKDAGARRNLALARVDRRQTGAIVADLRSDESFRHELADHLVRPVSPASEGYATLRWLLEPVRSELLEPLRFRQLSTHGDRFTGQAAGELLLDFASDRIDLLAWAITYQGRQVEPLPLRGPLVSAQRGLPSFPELAGADLWRDVACLGTGAAELARSGIEPEAGPRRGRGSRSLRVDRTDDAVPSESDGQAELAQIRAQNLWSEQQFRFSVGDERSIRERLGHGLVANDICLGTGSPDQTSDFLLGETEPLWSMLRHRPEPTERSWLIEWLPVLKVPAVDLVARFVLEPDLSARRALLLALGGYDRPAGNDNFPCDLLAILRTAPDPGLRSKEEDSLRSVASPKPRRWESTSTRPADTVTGSAGARGSRASSGVSRRPSMGV
jgi:hypothetical protein